MQTEQQNTFNSGETTVCPCQEMVNLCKQRSLDTLHQQLVTSLQRLFPDSRWIALYKDGSRCDTQTPLYELGKLADAHTNSSKVLLYDGKTLLGSLFIDGVDSNNTLLRQMVKMYCNLYNHLSRAYRDNLTQLRNRESLTETITRLQALQQRRQLDRQPLHHAIAVMDIDFFKQVNDQHGHLFGDEILLLLAQMMTKSFRANDYLFRYGGEEFVILLTDIPMPKAQQVLDRFRQQVEAHRFPQQLRLTLSIGFARLTAQAPWEILLERADKALYHVKQHGRNQCFSYENLLQQGNLERIDVRDSGIDYFK